jgi:Myb-like DNA-binding domain
VLKPGLVKGQWSKEEDARLLLLVEKRCYKNWGCLAQHMDGRTSKQVLNFFFDIDTCVVCLQQQRPPS